MEKALMIIDKYLGMLYRSMFKVIDDSGDFIQGFKKIMVKEFQGIVNEIFDFGIKICMGFIALDLVLLYLGKGYTIIPVYSKIIALAMILAYKYNVTKNIVALYPRLRKQNSK